MVVVYTSKTGPYRCVILENTGKAPDSGTNPERGPRPGDAGDLGVAAAGQCGRRTDGDSVA